MNSKNIIVVIGILAAVALGIYIIPKTKDLTNGSVDTGGIVTFIPNPSQYNILAPKTTVPTPAKTTPTSPKPAATPTPAPASHVVIATAPTGLVTYSAPEIGMQFSIPSSWQIKTETANPDNILLYSNSGATMDGIIEVQINADQTFDSLILQLSADPTISNIHQYTVNGAQAVSYQSLIYGNLNIAIVAGDNIYYFRGGATAPEIINSLRLANPTDF